MLSHLKAGTTPPANLHSGPARPMLPPARYTLHLILPAAPPRCAAHCTRAGCPPQAKAQKLLRLWKQQQLLERSALEQMQEALGAEVEATSSLRRSSRVQAASMSVSHEAGSEQVGGGAECSQGHAPQHVRSTALAQRQHMHWCSVWAAWRPGTCCNACASCADRQPQKISKLSRQGTLHAHDIT